MSRKTERSVEDDLFKDFEKKKKKMGPSESDKKPKFANPLAIPEVYGVVFSSRQPKKKGKYIIIILTL